MVEKALLVQRKFKLAQMLQGENAPGNVLQLQELIETYGHEVFRFYILFLLGLMSGLAGGQGSRFMDSANARGVITGIESLMPVSRVKAQVIYWNFMTARALCFGMPTETPEDMALVRLACLIRARGPEDILRLHAAWYSLALTARETLVDHFLSDGIDRRAFVLDFLPLCLSNAQANSMVKLAAVLEVIVELLGNLSPFVDDITEIKDIRCLHVDLSDLAEFISVVQNRFVLQTCVTRCQVRVKDKCMYLDMTGDNWSRTTDPDSDMAALVLSVKNALRQVDVVKPLGAMVFEGSHGKLFSRQANVKDSNDDDDIDDDVICF
eukprot:TRINITY_DN18100_c0_g1_i1.p1 TRINITY_DN18100_c0_g1~~TRINITY_DN18100_c0_g1_i1.p1  ORF type:complete len:346 (+),score=52.50 TRINITY_DN18100_c0_g1_i1:72-1040(+)